MVTIRARATADVAVLAEVLAGQQPDSGYPFVWPLPMAVSDFIAQPDDEAAWVAEVGGAVVGQVSVDVPDEPERGLFAKVLGTDRFATVSRLFVASSVVGTGVGGALLGTAVDRIRSTGRLPALEVWPGQPRAYDVYRHLGWREVGSTRFDWLPADAPSVVLMTLD